MIGQERQDLMASMDGPGNPDGSLSTRGESAEGSRGTQRQDEVWKLFRTGAQS